MKGLLSPKYTIGSAPFPIKLMNEEVIFQSTLANSTVIGSQRRIEPTFYAKYDNSDLRKSCFFGTSAGLITFKGSYSGDVLCFSGLAVDEQYLIRAECYAREGSIDLAMNDLNSLMKKRWNSAPGVIYPVFTAVDANEALTKILVEREKELFGRGLRWSDLRRLNRDPRFVKTITRTVAGVSYTLKPNSFQYTFPIPDDVILKTGIAQNVGWSK